MSSYTGYNRRPTYSNTGYDPTYSNTGYNSGNLAYSNTGYNTGYNSDDPTYSNTGYNSGGLYNQTRSYRNGRFSNRDYDRGRYTTDRVGSGHSYNYSNYNGYNTNYEDDYEDDHTRPYGPRRRSGSFTQTYPDSPIATYSNVLPSTSGTQYYTDGQQYPITTTTRSSRRNPVVISGEGATYTARPAVQYLNPTNSNSGFRAEGERGETIPISNGLSYYQEGISLSTWIRRLFGLGPKRSRGHVGRSIHVKRWNLGGAWFSSLPGRSNASVYTI